MKQTITASVSIGKSAIVTRGQVLRVSLDSYVFDDGDMLVMPQVNFQLTYQQAQAFSEMLSRGLFEYTEQGGSGDYWIYASELGSSEISLDVDGETVVKNILEDTTEPIDYKGSNRVGEMYGDND